MIVRTDGPNDIPALQAIDKKARTVYAALAGFEFAAAGPPIAVDRLACALPAQGLDTFLTVCGSPDPGKAGKRRKSAIQPPLTWASWIGRRNELDFPSSARAGGDR